MSDDHRKRGRSKGKGFNHAKSGAWASGRSLSAWLGHIVFISKSAASKEPAEVGRRFVRNTNNLVRRPDDRT